MTAGLGESFNILQETPYKFTNCGTPAQAEEDQEQGWVPSRYNIRATAEDGHLVLWNTLSGAMNVFTPEQAPLVIGAIQKRSGIKARRKGLVAYLVERGFLVTENSNEFRQFQMNFSRQQFRTDVLQLTLMSSEDCNFRCNYCYEDFARGTMRPEVRQGIRKLVEERAPRLQRLLISWFGGEPLYGWEAVEDLGPFFADIVEKYDLGFSSNMTTNGYLLTPDRAELLISWGIKHFQITIDGGPDDHDRNRPARDGSSTFWQIFENLKALARRKDDFSVTLRMNIDKDNHEGIPDFLNLLEEALGTDPRFVLNFQPVNQWGGENDQNLNVCGTDSKTVIRELVQAAQQKGFHLDSLKIAQKMGENVCYAARPYQYLIGAHGQVMKCTILLDKDPANVVGQLTPEGELQLDHDRMSLWTEPVYERDTGCKKCVLLPNCAGSYCPLPRIQGEGKKCVPERSAPKASLLRMYENGEKRSANVSAS